MPTDNTQDSRFEHYQHRDGEPDLAAALQTALTDADPGRDQDWATFGAAYLGFCPRQTYLVHLGIRDNTGRRGRFRARRLIQDYLQEKLEATLPHVEFTPTVALDTGRVRVVGRPTAYDPTASIVYHIKPRNGWYKFHPPIDRHLNQLHLYMRGLDADRGQLVYVSMTDLADIRIWPADYQNSRYVAVDAERASRLTTNADHIRDQIVRHGIATTTDEIPFERCGCYLCQTEDIDLPAHAETGDNPSTGDVQPTSDLLSTASSRPHPDIDAAPLNVTTGKTTVLATDTTHVPAGLQDERIWVVWDGTQKRALAPWQSGTMYPCEWAQANDVDPRRPFEKAQMVAELSISAIHEAWPFPDGDDLPDDVLPAVLLPHETSESPLTFVDFDDVRDPDTGTVPAEVSTILDVLGGYAEISQSGTGIHCWVRGGLPDGVSTFTAPLDSEGHIELYDHSRFTGGTWCHIEGTPLDVIPNVSSVIERIIATYT